MFKTVRFLTLMILIAGLGACGEGFRGQSSLDSFQDRDSEYFDSQGNRRSFTQNNVDQEILRDYANELQGRESATRNMSDEIRAFDLSLTADSNQNFSMLARIVVDCDDAYEIESRINRSQLQAMQSIILGDDGPYEVEVRCTSGSCQELVAVIRKISGSNRGTVLVGLAVGGQSEGEILYVSRQVDHEPYFASYTNIPNFESRNSCSIGNGGSSSIGDILTDRAVEVGQELLESWWEQKGDELIDSLF